MIFFFFTIHVSISLLIIRVSNFFQNYTRFPKSLFRINSVLFLNEVYCLVPVFFCFPIMRQIQKLQLCQIGRGLV